LVGRLPFSHNAHPSCGESWMPSFHPSTFSLSLYSS
jgi:hypothetical protein